MQNLELTDNVKKYFKENRNSFYISPPILCRQVATHIVYDEVLNIFVDGSFEINEKYRHEAYIRECSNEYLKKYKKYNLVKKNIYSTKMFERLMKNILPTEIILEIKKYII